MCSPDCAGHAGPWLLEGQDTLDIVAVDLLAGDGVDNGRLDTEEGEGGGAGLSRRDTTERCNDVRTGLSLPVSLIFVSVCFSFKCLTIRTSTT